MHRTATLALVLAGVTLGHAGALRGLAAATVQPSPTRSFSTHTPPVRAARVTIAPQGHAGALTRSQPTPIAAASTGSAPTSLPAGDYLPAHQLDWPALPRSAPDTTLLDGHVLSGLPLILRLYIDAQGHVTRVEPLQLADDDRAALPALQAMFTATAYSPGRLDGRDVGSTLDLSLGVETVAQDDSPDTALKT